MTMTPRSRLFLSAETKRYLRRQALLRFTFAVAGTFLAWFAMVTFTAPAHARGLHHRHHAIHRNVASRIPAGIITCDLHGCRGEMNAIIYIHKNTKHEARTEFTRTARFDANGSGVKFIPNPPGTWRIYRSCAHRLAAYWGLGKGLDAVSTWPHVFARAFGPGVGIAAIRNDRGHVMGIIGGGPGAWRVADFNSGRHLNREYTVANFQGFFFVDTRQRMANR